MQKTMKKVLSLVLSLMIIMPCIGIIPVNAAGLDRTELDAVIEQAKALNADDYVDVAAVNAAVESATNNDLNTQTKIDDATAKIQLEMYKLENADKTEKKNVFTYSNWLQSGKLQVTGKVTVKNVDGGNDVSGTVNVWWDSANTYRHPATNATAYVYADLNKAATLKDLNVTADMYYTGPWVRYETGSLAFNGTSLGSIFHDGWKNGTSYSSKSIGPYTLDAELAEKGSSVMYELKDSGCIWDQPDNATHYVYQIIELTVASYDTTALREAISQQVVQKSAYTAESYEKYIAVLIDTMAVLNTPVTTVALDGEGANYEDIVAAQIAMDNAAEALNNAYNSLEVATQLDMTAFNAAVAEANAKIAESEKYVSIESLLAVRNNAINTSFETQEEVNDATAKIKLEISKLELVPADKKNISTYSWWLQQSKLDVKGRATIKNVDGGNSVSGTVNVWANTAATARHPETNATAYVYADLNKAATLKDLNVTAELYYTGPWVRYQPTSFYFNEKSIGSFLFDGWALDAVKYTSRNLGPYTLDAELAQKGSSVMYELKDSTIMHDQPDNAAHYVYQIIELTVASYDTTALREAMAKRVEEKSHYSVTSYAAYIAALDEASKVLNTPVTTVELDGEGANYADIAAAQTAIDNAAKALNDAYNALKKDFNIEYYNDGVLFKSQTVSYADGETTLLSDVPSKTGYVFLNTWKSADGNDYTPTTVAHELATEDGSTVRLDANYREAKYTVKFDLDGGSPDIAPVQYDYNTEITLPEAPAKTGFTFAGWKIGDKTYSVGDKVSKLSATDGDTVTITAQWNENSYTIHFDANGGDQAYTDVELKYTKEYIVPAAPTMTGHAFTGWLGSDGKLYYASQTVSKLSAVDGSVVTLTAQWDKVVYSVSLEKEPDHYTVTGLDSTIDAVYGTINFKVTVDPAYNQNELIVDAVNATITPLTDGSYQLSNATGNVIVKISDHSKINTYTVKFTDGENDIATFENVEYGSKVNVPDMPISKVVEKDGVRTEYFFIGWLVNGKKVDDAANYAITADTTFVAQYSAEEYVWVTFMSQDGSTQLLRKSVKKGEPTYYGLTAPTKAATAQYTYTFVGWNTEPNSETATYSVAAPIPTTSEITVYAAFSKALRNYKVTLPSGEGYTATEVNGLNLDAVSYGTTVTFTVTVDRAYSNSVPAVKLNGEAVAAKSVNNNVYTYEFVVNGNSEITVDNSSVKKNVYTAVLPTGTGFKASVAAGYDAAKITDGENFCFTIALDKAYSKSTLTVKYNGEVLTAVDGVYTISNVNANIEGITVEGAKINIYTVNFVDGDGNVIQTSTIEYGQLASYLGATPTKTPTATVSYKFIGWDKDPAILAITDDTTFTAQFEESEALILTVKFVDDQGNVLKTYKTIYGGSVVYDGEIPEKAADEAGHFEFVGWDKGYANVTSNMTIRPKFVQKNHNPSEVRKEATCGVNGYVRMVCDDCGYIISEKTLVATGHHYGEWVTTVQPTHTTNGRQERKCTACGDVELEILGRLPDHEYVATVKVAATCTEDGIMLYKCACGDSYEKVIPKLGHHCDEWTIVKEPTCTEAGSETGICSRCDSSIENVIPAKGHNVPEYKDNGDGTSSGTCSECGEKVTIKNPDSPDKPTNPDKPSSTNWFTKIINWFKKIFKIIKGWFTKKNSIEIMY